MAIFRQNSGENRKDKHRYQQGYMPPRQVEDYWKIYKKGVYLEKPSRQGPGWVVPLLAFLMIMFLVFWAVPLAISRIQAADSTQETQDQTVIQTLYDQHTFTTSVPVADVYDRPDIKANRVTQILFNEPVTVLPDQGQFGYIKIKLDDNTEGYTLTENLTSERASIEPGFHAYKLVVASPVKRIMSHASRGTLLAEVMMGTVLFADYQGDSIFRITMPDGGEGWASADGLIILEPDATIQIPAEPERYFVNSVLEFSRVTVLNNGLTVRGATVNGVARVAGYVNGINLPRRLEEQFNAGELVYDKRQSENMPDYSLLVSGDLLFFADSSDSDLIQSLGIFIGGSEMLYAGQSDSSLRIVDLSQAEQGTLLENLVSVRRIF